MKKALIRKWLYFLSKWGYEQQIGILEALEGNWEKFLDHLTIKTGVKTVRPVNTTDPPSNLPN
ncbi:MAG: hypothetical protein K6T66_00870 [Peptococcaceae bacterium]|nr:hypothetical protein [Peptococcaceae bacterium]